MKITKDLLDLAKHIVEQKWGHFDPSKFEDHYEGRVAGSYRLLHKRDARPAMCSTHGFLCATGFHFVISCFPQIARCTSTKGVCCLQQ